jgi:putative endonuclease
LPFELPGALLYNLVIANIIKRPPAMPEWYVYILQCADQTLYTGVATDIAARTATHNAGKGAKYTRGRLPAVLVYQEKAGERGPALKREHAIKKMRAETKRELIASGTPADADPL